jgi:hypothetical protein
METVLVILRRRRGERENNGGDEHNWVHGKHIYVYMEMSQGKPLYNYYVLIKMFFTEDFIGNTGEVAQTISSGDEDSSVFFTLGW